LGKSKGGSGIGRFVLLTGAFLAFFIGAGFSTGQETLQFFASYGWKCIIALIAFFIIEAYFFMNIAYYGRHGLTSNKSIFHYIGGKYLGTFLDYFAIWGFFSAFILMISGGGATLNQQYGIPVMVGIIFTSATVLVTVAFGLKRIVDVIGRLGPFIVILVILAAIVGIAMNPTAISGGARQILDMDVLNVGPSIFTSIYLYNSFTVLWFVSFFSEYGKNEKKTREVDKVIAVGLGLAAVTILLVSMAIWANVEVAKSAVPILDILNKFSNGLGATYSVVIFLGLYTTACPLLWSVGKRFFKERSKSYLILIMVCTVIAGTISMFVPYATVFNYTTYNGYVAVIAIFLVIIRHIMTVVKKDNGIDKFKEKEHIEEPK